MPTKSQKNKVFFKRLICFVLVFVFVLGGVVMPIKYVGAQAIPSAGGFGPRVQTFAPGEYTVLQQIMLKDEVRYNKSWWEKFMDSMQRIQWKIAIVNAIDNFAQNMAQKTATFLASAAKGEKSLSWGDAYNTYIEKSLDLAAGDFIEGVATSWEDFAGDLCKPNPNMQLKFGLALFNMEEPPKPKCTFSEMKNNWNEAVNDPDFLKNFSVSFEPSQNDMGVWLGLVEKKNLKKEQEKEAALYKRGPDSFAGIKSLDEKITGDTTTPAGMIKSDQDATNWLIKASELTKSDVLSKAETKTEIAELIGVRAGMTFLKSLANEALKVLYKGLYGTYGLDDVDWNKLKDKLSGDSVTNPAAQNTRGGKQAAEAQYSKYIKTNLSESGSYDVLSELASCNNSKKIPGPTTCVIDNNFASAIQDKLTVREAIEKGLLDGNKVVGYKTGGKEITYLEGYPYRSLLILRKYRIIPVGWELAAEYFANYGGDSDAPTLNRLIDAYDDTGSPYYRLVDPNWVLKLPSGYCKARGVGPEIIMEQINQGSDSNGDGDWEDSNDVIPSKSISRNDQYCADEQSCIKEGLGGNCEYYGYCMEEKRLWKFDGEACDEINNTCQSFVAPDGEVVSYLKNSLDFDSCSKNNSGCQWYCNQFNSAENSLTSKGAAAYWSMDELISGGAKVKDEIGNSDGTLKGNTSLATGKFGKALSFDGTGDYVEAQDNNSLNIQDDFSAEAWLKTTASSEKVIDKYKSGDGYSCEVASGKWSCSHIDNSNVISSISATSVNDGKWHHVAWTVDGANKQYLYVDGVLEITNSLSSHSANISNNLVLYIGINDGTSQGFNGQIDELSIYNRVLSSDEIWNNYISYNCITNNDKIYLSDSAVACEAEDAGCNEYLAPENGLVGYWKFDKGEGAVIYDSSGSGNDGTLKNGAAWAGGKSGQGLQFDGTDDYADVPRSGALDTGDVVAISLWVKRGAFGTAQYIIHKGTGAFAVGFDANNYVSFEKSDAGTICLSTTKIEDNNWHNIIIIKNKAVSKIYIDGADKTGAVADYTLTNNSSPLAFGSNSVAAAGFLNGLIDEVAIYNRALNEQEISSLYNGGINFSNTYIKAANKNLQCFGRTAGDAVFDLPSYADNCIALGPRYDSCGYNTCFEFLSYKTPKDCAANNGVWSSLAIKIPRHTVQSYCENNGGVWTGTQCQTNCLKLDDAACSDYAFSCKSSELGCEKYTPTQGGSFVPGVISDDDLCPSECAGYDTYKQESTNFETSKFPVNFIPKTAKSCPSNNAGCDEFTNLEAAGGGGESLEYYTYLRQCEKIPTASAGYQCGDFYTWVGSDATGYQLQSYYLKSNTLRDLNSDGALDEEPVEILRVEEYLGECNNANDALTNKNCKEFYNSKGVISYHLLKKTITCSDDCINYRKTAPAEFDLKQVCKNIGGTWVSPNCNITNQEACKAVSGTWSGICDPKNIADSVFCANANYLNAVWDEASSTCSKTDYSAIPTEGIKCQLAANGCRQYTGNAGGNAMNVFNDNFESDSYLYGFPDAGRGWSNGSLSSESTDSDQKSLKVNNGQNQIIKKWLSAECALTSTCAKDAGCPCSESAGLNDGDATNSEVVCTVPIDSDSCMVANYTYNKGTYLLSFWAKGNKGNNITVKITDGVKNQEFGSVTLSDQWREFTLGPLEFNVESWNNYQLSFEDIKSNGGTPDSVLGAFFDNVKLQAISDSIYAIKNSWRTPASCDRDWQGNSYLYYMLGCDEYSDTQGALHYLKSFSNLCRVDAVGCQKLIDIHNFSEPFAKTWNIGDESEVAIPSRDFVYLARTQDYSCMQSSVGCTELGKPLFNQDQTIVKGFDTVYKINDPDYYDTSLCLKKNVGCQTFTSASGEYYFKDPGKKVCEYVQPTYQQDYGWYKKSDSYDINSQKCPTSNYQNLGVDFPSGLCIGGVENGKNCLSAQDNQLEDRCIGGGGSCNSGLCVLGTENGKSCLSKCGAGGGYCGNWAGACVSPQSGCSAFVDPISDSSVSLVTNSLFNKDLDGNGVPDNWKELGDGLKGFYPAQEYVDAIYVDGADVFSQSPIIKPNTTYVVSADIKKYPASADNALVQVECLNYVDGFAGCPSDKDKGFYLADESGKLTANATCGIKVDYRAGLIIPASKLTSDFSRYSMRFFSGTCNKVRLSFGGTTSAGAPVRQSFHNVSLREAGVYYYIDSSLDAAKRECNGYVNSEKGCVLLNDRNNSSLKTLNFTNYLNYNADKLTSAATSCVGSDGSKFACNADTLMKVRPERDCNKWLYCTDSKIANGVETCSNVGICDKMNKNGKCVSNPLEYSDVTELANMTFDIANIDKTKNLSGYSKVGFDWSEGETIEGNLPPSQMTIFGSGASLANGDFELGANGAGYSRKPIGWDVYECSIPKGADCKAKADCKVGEDCDGGVCKVVCEKDADCPTDVDTGIGEICENKFCKGAACDFDTDCRKGQKCEDNHWNVTDFGLVNNPIEEQKIGIDPISGDNILRLTSGSANGGGHALSEDVYVNTDTNYVLSGYINTRDFSATDKTRVFGAIKILQDNAAIIPGGEVKVESGSKGWTYVQTVFKTNATFGKIKVKLADVANLSEYCENCDGEIYFDDISIRPVISTNELSLANGSYTPMSCRLFPQSEASSCEYESKDGYKYKGWYGYCLEHDPVYPQYCLNWYPVEDASGSSVGENYGGKIPLYYCLEAKAGLVYPSGWQGPNIDNAGPYNIFWRDREDVSEFIQAGTYQTNYIKEIIPGNIYTATRECKDVGYNGDGCCIKENNNDQLVLELNDSRGDSKADWKSCIVRNATGEIVFTWSGKVEHELYIVFTPLKKWYCNKVVRVVTDSGQNKYWASRLSNGSSYIVDGLNYTYKDDDIPFGSIVPPDPQSNPGEWDGDTSLLGNQPIFTSSSVPLAAIRAGSPYSCDGTMPGGSATLVALTVLSPNGDGNVCHKILPAGVDWWLQDPPPMASYVYGDAAERVKRLFAESYGVWEWNETDGKYESMGALGPSWIPPAQPAGECADDVRPLANDVNPNNYCGIPPKVEHLTVNGQPPAGKVLIDGGGYVSLKFNSVVDSQQLPLISYEIRWGDTNGNVTGESGTALIDKPSENDPHNFSHEYRFTTLYVNQDDTELSIICGNNCGKDIGGCADASKSDKRFCRVMPTVKITDNWGWTSGVVSGPPVYVLSNL